MMDTNVDKGVHAPSVYELTKKVIYLNAFTYK